MKWFFPHGIGDFIIWTPVLRAWWRLGGECDVVLKGYVYESGVATHCPYIGEVEWVDLDYRGLKEPREKLELWTSTAKEMKACVVVNGIDMHKALWWANIMGIPPGEWVKDPGTEVFTKEVHAKLARELVRDLTRGQEWGFVHQEADSKRKSVRKDEGRKWMERRGLMPLEVGAELSDVGDINVIFEVLRMAEAVYVTDSAFYHAAHAMGKKVDVAYFGPAEEDRVRVYNQVRPWIPAPETVYWVAPDG